MQYMFSVTQIISCLVRDSSFPQKASVGETIHSYSELLVLKVLWHQVVNSYSQQIDAYRYTVHYDDAFVKEDCSLLKIFP